MVKKIFLSAVLALLCAITAFAEVEIPQEKRVKNLDSGVCVWCAVENLGNVHGIDQLKGIAKYRHDKYGKVRVWVEGTYMIDQFGRWVQIQGPHWSEHNEAPGTPDRVRDEFKRLKIKYKMQTHGNYDKTIIDDAVKNKLGCAVGLKDYPNKGDYHMVTLTDLTKEKVVFVDNNGKCPRVEKTREWFFDHWSGYTIVVIPEKMIAPQIEESRETEKPDAKEERGGKD